MFSLCQVGGAGFLSGVAEEVPGSSQPCLVEQDGVSLRERWRYCSGKAVVEEWEVLVVCWRGVE